MVERMSWEDILKKQYTPKQLFDLVDFPTDDGHLDMWDNISNGEKYMDALEQAEDDNIQYENYFDIWYIPNSKVSYNDRGGVMSQVLFDLKDEYYQRGQPEIFEGVKMRQFEDANGNIDYEGWDKFADIIWDTWNKNKEYESAPTLVAAPLDANIGDDKEGTLIAGFHRAGYNWENNENKVVYFRPKVREKEKIQ